MKRLLFFLILFIHVHSLLASNQEHNDLVQAIKDKKYNDPTWLSLLHIHKSKNDINDSIFYIDNKIKNAFDEFVASYNSFFVQKNTYEICRFPARFLWLNQTLNLSNVLPKCPELIEFEEKAPLEKVYVIFASENISVPSSMMGHIFLKFSGTNKAGLYTEHAISFFTNVNDISFPALVAGSLITGMKGYYTLSPYQSHLENYLYNEQRNVWEYELKLDENQRKLLYYHLYELKNITFNYYFHGFNCATLISNIVSVPFPELKNERGFWVTPLDVIRGINKNELLLNTKINSASKWDIKSILETQNFSKKVINLLKARDYRKFEMQQLDSKEQFLLLELSLNYNNYLYEELIITKDDWEKDNLYLKELMQNLEASKIDFSEYKKPSLTIPDTQFSINYFDRDNDKFLALTFLPTSHSLQDDTINFNNESELKLGEVTFSYELNKKKVHIDKVILYSAVIFNPHNPLTGGISGKVDAGYGFELSKEFQFEKFYRIKGGLGKTFRLFQDIDFFALLDSSIKYNNYFLANIGPELGFILREVYGMKTIASYSHFFNSNSQLKITREFKFIQSFNFDFYSINVSWNKFFKCNEDISELQISSKWLF